jgi:hypothetical protein
MKGQRPGERPLPTSQKAGLIPGVASLCRSQHIGKRQDAGILNVLTLDIKLALE